MGLCASLLKPEAKKKRYPEPRRGMPKALFVDRAGRGQQQYYKPKPAEAPVVFQAHDDVPAGRSRRLHEPGNVEKRKCYQGSGGGDALDYRRFICARMPSGGVTTVTTTMVPCRRKTTDMTRATPPMTPVWQRRILMGMRCELPRFSGLILYDEHPHWHAQQKKLPAAAAGEEEDYKDFNRYNSQGPAIVTFHW